MKTLIPNYTFDPASQQATLTDFATVSLDRLLLITNVTHNTIIYSFADPAKGCSVSGNVITFDTPLTVLAGGAADMQPGDRLQIFYEDAQVPATETALDEVGQTATDMKAILQLLQSLVENNDVMARQFLQLLRPLTLISNSTAGRGSLLVEPINMGGITLNTVSTVTGVTTVTTVNGVNNVVGIAGIGGMNAFDLQFNAARTAHATSVRPNLSF